ncbi:MAG: ATP-binding cassette domain-containing protein [Candidatus Aminicenantes bacterium]|nr:ATP-binding cassette domain-containing protein [Candidatus Aminicenantes bacterium]NIM78209.1 ATP-binding cassette domain-containing protein [Candidatus Aminicenantes bacterium]NIN23715.1 ATP-binding cassette domain-containing protein [Candidatus Aminicenantes bacterium]NIN47422.1 ATP-binding cassette domain-containing protein [Candidatus Aminicenantes bacterium]NIN90350.1 ATP-binding cassette domain-containing protein [Candidatus Aminicenantes bacterium]
MANENIIETFGLTKYYRRGIIGIEDLSLTVNQGEIYGFLGRNGAGKTTTIRMLVNLIFPTRGRARIFGKDMVKHHLEICKNIGYIPSAVRPHKHMTGEDFLNYMGNLSANGDIQYRNYLLKKFDFSQKDLKRKIKEYSGGMARKIALVQTFQHRPRLMIMDEPTEGLDPVMQHTFYELLKEYRDNGGTVFISSHHLLEVEQVCDRAAIIRSGRLVAVEKIHELMNHMARTLQVKFKNPVGASHLESDAWEIVNKDGTSLTAKVTGDIDKVIKFLSRFDIKDISLPKPSLQDVFLDYYRLPEEDQ